MVGESKLHAIEYIPKDGRDILVLYYMKYSLSGDEKKLFRYDVAHWDKKEKMLKPNNLEIEKLPMRPIKWMELPEIEK